MHRVGAKWLMYSSAMKCFFTDNSCFCHRKQQYESREREENKTVKLQPDQTFVQLLLKVFFYFPFLTFDHTNIVNECGCGPKCALLQHDVIVMIKTITFTFNALQFWSYIYNANKLIQTTLWHVMLCCKLTVCMMRCVWCLSELSAPHKSSIKCSKPRLWSPY